MPENLSSIPAHRRRLLLVDTSAEYTRMRMNQETRRMLATPALRFVDLQDALASDDRLLQSLAAKGLLQAGALLIQSLTVPDQYTRLSTIGDQTAASKVNVTVRICQLLGARRVEIRHAEFTSQQKSSGKARRGPGPRRRQDQRECRVQHRRSRRAAAQGRLDFPGRRAERR